LEKKKQTIVYRQLLSALEIKGIIAEMAAAINKYYTQIIKEKPLKKIRFHRRGKLLRKSDSKNQIVLICILKSGYRFFNDLTKKLNFNFIEEFLYPKDDINFRTDSLLQKIVKKKHVIIIDSIFDSGKTIFQISKEIKKHSPFSITAAVLIKRGLGNEKDKNYLSFTNNMFVGKKIRIKNFLIGYGLDFDQGLRFTNSIVYLEDNHDKIKYNKNKNGKTNQKRSENKTN